MRPHIICTVVIATAAILMLFPVTVIASTDADPEPPLVIAMQKSPQALTISGNVSSTAHEIILRQTAQRYFGDLRITLDLQTGSLVPPGWALTTELVLRALAYTDAARARVSASSVSIEGVTTRPDEYALGLQRVKSALVEGMSVASDVSSLSSGVSFDELCQDRFRRTAASGVIEFARSTTDFGEKSLPLLDALIEIAVDCPTTVIRVTGHTDNSGNAAANEVLGRARARRIIEYMAGRGVPADQLEAAMTVHAASDPEDSNASSRARNRRVNLELVIP